jgi:hypothetical protein
LKPSATSNEENAQRNRNGDIADDSCCRRNNQKILYRVENQLILRERVLSIYVFYPKLREEVQVVPVETSLSFL